MCSKQDERVKNPVLSKKDIAVLLFSPRAIVHGLQGIGLTLKEQLSVLTAILEKYGKRMDAARREYLKSHKSQITALT